MAARYNLEALLISILVASCANGVAGENRADCEYKYTNAQMIEKFKDVMSNETGDRKIYESNEAVFEVQRKNCNYYVKFKLKPALVNGGALVIFDKAAEVVHSGWR